MAVWTPFSNLNEVLAQLLDGARAALGDNFVAAFLQGSFALGDADEGSDVDFIVVTRRFLSSAEEQAVTRLQEALYALPSPWGQHLEGSYFPADLLRSADSAGTRIPYFDHGSRTLEHSVHDNTLVVRWTARESGVTLAEPPPRDLIEPVSPEALRAEVRDTLHRWGAELRADPVGLDNGWRQPYVALSIARMLHTLETGRVHSKRDAVGWAQGALPEWADLLERAWAQHPTQATRYKVPADPHDLERTRAFIRFALEREGWV